MLATPSLNFNPLPVGRLVFAESRRRQWAETEAKTRTALKALGTPTPTQQAKDAQRTLQCVCMRRLRAERRGEDLAGYPKRIRRPSTFDFTVTFTGLRFYPRDPKPKVIQIEDIAHALSLVCRFGGHLRDFYSVAQHSLHVASLLPERLKLVGLLHDATEAYLGDMVKPLKELLPSYRELEHNLWRVIARRFGLPQVIDPAVKEADITALATERRDLKPDPYRWRWRLSDEVMPDREPIRPVGPQEAERMFLQEFCRLTA